MFPYDISENCRDFLYKTLKFNSKDRHNAVQLLEHPFIKDCISFFTFNTY